MDVFLFLGVVTGISGLVLLIMGYLISIKQKINLINGVDFSNLSDVRAFAKYVGNSILLMGILMLLSGVGLYYKVLGLIGYTFFILIICAIPLPAFLLAKNKYTNGAS